MGITGSRRVDIWIFQVHFNNLSIGLHRHARADQIHLMECIGLPIWWLVSGKQNHPEEPNSVDLSFGMLYKFSIICPKHSTKSTICQLACPVLLANIHPSVTVQLYSVKESLYSFPTWAIKNMTSFVDMMMWRVVVDELIWDSVAIPPSRSGPAVSTDIEDQGWPHPVKHHGPLIPWWFTSSTWWFSSSLRES
jgi:hypothetical protein